uniref:Uncharacterized protein n=2 Tax=unclassified Caudoviricetes TaxID=2788787 RepID=A0A8S5PKA2_9CAUD|nr:MAG TPA: hypothetical protein [Siphoviridae sp. ctJcm18]DAE06604.1 MAG TPA: hypothetical protein [Siphoviridae sp. ctUGQ45]
MADISKIKLANGTTVTIKDAQGRADMTTILGGHALEALGAAAWQAMAASISDAGIADAATVKAYVDSQVGQIHNFDVVIDPAGTTAGPSVVASADTMYKIYLVPSEDAAAGGYIEYITIRSGAEGAYTYTWEAIGNTKVSITGYVPITTTIATIALDHNITVAELQTALKLGAMAYADKASGSATLQTIDSITMKEVTVAGNAAVTSKAADATLTKANYTPAGKVTGSAISDGSINVTLKDSATKTEATLSTSEFTPAGTIAAKEGGSFSALKTAAFGAAEDGVQIEGTVSAPAISLTAADKTFATGLTGGKAASFTEGAFTPAAIQDGFYTAGKAATWTGADYTAPTMGEASKAKFASEGIVADVGSGDDAETLIFSAAGTADAVTAQGAFNAGNVDFGTFNGGSATVIDTTKFSGGSKATDTFVPNELQSVTTGKVSEVSAAELANAPVFTGSKYAVATTADTALKDVAFTATNSATIVDKVEYVKPEIDAATFTGTAATLGFAGTEVVDALVTGVKYDKADATAAFSVAVTPETDVITKTAKTIEIEVSPVAKAGE